MTLTKTDFANNMKPTGTTTQFRQERDRGLTVDGGSCKLGKLCWLATVSRPNICARLARFASSINQLKAIDIYRINGLARTVKSWKPRDALKYTSPEKRHATLAERQALRTIFETWREPARGFPDNS